MKKICGLALAILLASTSAARAEDSKDEGELSLGFSSSKGLAGMRDMIDARCPETINARGLLRFDYDTLNLDSRSTAHAVDVYSANFIAGASFLGFLDAGLRLPMEIRVQQDDLHGGPSRRITANGVGDAEVSGKAGFKLGPITVGPYATIHWNTGSRLLEKTNTLVFGGAGTVALWHDRIAVHGNVTSVFFDGGKWGVDYRIGASVVPYADSTVVMRLWAYLDGLSYVGKKVRGTDGRIAVGAQALLFKIVTLDVGTGVKILSEELPRNISDIGTYGIELGGGVSLTF